MAFIHPRGSHLCQEGQECLKYHPFYHLAPAFTPIGARPDVITGASQQTLASGDKERVVLVTGPVSPE